MGRRGDFFTIDRRSWAVACSIGLNSAAAYLVLGAFSERSNRFTNASVNAVEKYTGISRGRARDAIDHLVHEGLVRRINEGLRPRYELPPFHEVHSVRRQRLDDLDRLIADGTQFCELSGEHAMMFQRGGDPQQLFFSRCEKLRLLGWLERTAVAYRPIGSPTPSPEWIWLPNDLATGTDVGETSPVERVRQTQDGLCLRLLVDLYSEQNLREDGGVRRDVVSIVYDRREVARRGPLIIWGWSSGAESSPRNPL